MDGPWRLNRTYRSSCSITVLLLGLLVADSGPLRAQTAPPERAPQANQQSFRLSHIELQTAAQQVRQLLANQPGAVVFADQSSGQLLVQAAPAQLSSVAELLSKIDRAAPAAGSNSNGENVLQAYPVPAAQREQAARWAADFKTPAGSRLAFDDRTGQLLVMGPANLHEFVKGQLNAQPAPAAPPTAQSEIRILPQPQTAATHNNQPVGPTKRLSLQHTTGAALHHRLEQLLSRPLPATSGPTGEQISFRAELIPGSGVAIRASRNTGEVELAGSPQQIAGWSSVLQSLDTPAAGKSVTQLISTQPSNEAQVRQALKVIESQTGQTAKANKTPGQLVTMMFQPQSSDAASQPATGEDEEVVGAVRAPGAGATGEGDEELDMSDGALLGPVQVQFVEGLDIILVRGNKRDVDRVMQIINRIEEVSAETVPAIEVLPLQHVESEGMARLLERVYSQVLGARTGTVSITPLGKPNSLLLVGRPENVKTAIDLVKRIDVPVEPTTRFEVYPLKFAVAGDVKQIVDAFLAESEGDDEDNTAALKPKALIVADFRTNSLFVNAGPRDLAEIEALIKRIDVDRGTAIDEVRIFPLKNTVASDLAEVLRTAVLARDEGEAQEGGSATSARVSALRFVTIDPANKKQLESGVLANIRIAADSQANSLVVTAPTESMELIEALINQLDQAPNAEAEIKVFTIVNGDALSLADMLRELFGTGEDGDNTGFGAGDNSLVRLQFSIDERTNSIIAAGTQADLAVVYAILLQLDASDTRQRSTEVYRLKNSPAENVALALNEWLRTEREAEAAAEIAISPFEQIEREVVIVPETVSNSLIVSATPRFAEEIAALIDELDERPAMVTIQVMIAEVRLNDTDEFGVELGLQDSLLFDRSVLDTQNFQTISTTINEQSPGGATITTEQETIVNAPLVPGFNFNNQPLGNNGSTSTLATAGTVAAQGLSNFALNRINPDLGFGGFVFSASSNSVSALLRALQENRRLEVLSRPQITALDNQEALIEVGQRVPRVQSTNITQFGQQNSVVYEPVGIILNVRPRISPDGMVVMELRAEKSQLGSEAEGIPIFTGLDGSVVRAPRIDQTIAQSTVAAASGQTIVLSGLLTKRNFDIHRSVPILSDIPLLGDLFRFDSVSEERTELLVILTPRVIRSEADAEMIKQVESSRMSWVLSDVVNMHGPSGLRSRCDDWTDTQAVYPTQIPGADGSFEGGTFEGSPVEGGMFQGELIDGVEMQPTPAEGPFISPQAAAPQRAGSVSVAQAAAAVPATSPNGYSAVSPVSYQPPAYQTAPARLPPVEVK